VRACFKISLTRAKLISILHELADLRVHLANCESKRQRGYVQRDEVIELILSVHAIHACCREGQ
jgi:hypothetical protein